MPLKWAASELHAVISSYQDAYGSMAESNEGKAHSDNMQMDKVGMVAVVGGSCGAQHMPARCGRRVAGQQHAFEPEICSDAAYQSRSKHCPDAHALHSQPLTTATPQPHPLPRQVVFKEVNVGFGAVDPLVYPSSTLVYPLPEVYLADKAACVEVKQDATLQTTQRLSYGPRWAAGGARLAEPRYLHLSLSFC